MNKSLQILVAGAAMSLSLAAAATEVTKTSVKYFDLENSAATFTLAGFDTSLGTLNSVQFSVYSFVSGTMKIENKGATAGSFSLGTGGDLTLHVAGLPDFTSRSIYTQIFSLPRYDGVKDYAGTSGVISPFSGQQFSAQTAVLTDAASLALFKNGNTIHAGLTDSFAAIASGNVFYKAGTQVDAYATVTYGYTVAAPVPEPESYAMLLAGLGLMGVVARKRKSQKAA